MMIPFPRQQFSLCRRVLAGLVTVVSLALSSAHPATTASQQDIAGMAGLAAWYRADNVAQSSDHTLTAWNDCSGRTRSIVPGAAAPTVVDNVLNGQPVVRFTGKESPLVEELSNWSANGFTVFVVAACSEVVSKPDISDNPRYRVNTPGKALVSDGGSAGLALGFTWNGRPGTTCGIPQIDFQSAIDPPYPSRESSDLVIEPRKFYLLTYASTEGKSKANAWDCKLNISVRANETASTADLGAFVSTQAMNGGKKLQIGAGGTQDRFTGDIAEIVIFNTALSADGRGRVWSYLRTKYALHDSVRFLPAKPVTITPSLEPGKFWFRDSVTVTMNTATTGGVIHYTTDGTAPSETSLRYSHPLTLTALTTIQAQAFAPSREASPVTTAQFIPLSAVNPPTADRLSGGWKYSWGDEFQGPGIDASIWGREIGYVRNSEAQYYSNRTENAQIEDGNLVIRGLYDNWNGHKYTSASVSTENKVALTYGRYELRAKIDIRSGSWPAWWLWSRPDAAGWPAEGEIDMMEYYTDKCLFNVVNGKGEFTSHRRRISTIGGPRWAGEFHVWTMEWDASRIDLYLDGALMLHYPVDSANGTGVKGENPYRHPETKKMVLNQAMVGSWGGDLDPANCPFELRVDWMRVHTWSQEPSYSLCVNGGVGSSPYVIGTRASITANMPPPGYAFDRWVCGTSAVQIDDPRRTTAILTMPASNVAVTATYVEVAGAPKTSPPAASGR